MSHIDGEWLQVTLNDAMQTLETALSLLEDDPRKARGVLEHEIPELYAKLNYAVNTAEIGPQAINIMDHDALIAWPENLPFNRRDAQSDPAAKNE